MKILLTGAEGNFGTTFQALAASKGVAPVVPIGRNDWATIEEKLDAVDVIIHAASDLLTLAGSEPSRWLESNLMSTAKLLEAARQQGVTRFIFISSCSVYGANLVTTESSECTPITISGVEKHLNEKLITQFCSANGMSCQILRVFNTYGGNDRFSVLSKIRKAIEVGGAFTLNNGGRVLRDFIHVRDVAAIVLKICSLQTAYSYINIGTGVATKISDIVKLVLTQFPELIVEPGSAKEVEYSRADTTRLSEFWDAGFIQVEDFVREQLIHQIVGQGSR
jgi:nucleoside-diphosphate-sugar epimerase